MALTKVSNDGVKDDSVAEVKLDIPVSYTHLTLPTPPYV